ncbi:MAG: DUF4426 domain-containing protein [Agarilytica sp.]
MRHILIGTFILAFYCFSSPAFSQVSAQAAKPYDTTTEFAEYTVKHVVFNSTFVLPEIAKIYKLKRSKYESLLNISIYKKGEVGSIPATISGTVKNLMQQQKVLDIKQIEEQNAVYYLSPVRVANEELLHFELNVRPKGSKQDLTVKFSQKVYADE